MLKNESIAAFAQSFRGQIVQPADPDYEEARKLYNAMIDKRPRIIDVREGDLPRNFLGKVLRRQLRAQELISRHDADDAPQHELDAAN